MMANTSKDTTVQTALAQATAWRIALSEEGADTSADFESWLHEDPAHAAAWKDVSGTWQYFDQHATAPELMDARRRALANARRHNRVRYRPRFAALGWRRAVAASVAALIMMTSFSIFYLSRPDVYETALGERRKVTLDDGSVLTIDSGSLLKVKLREEARTVELVRGQARFDVAHDSARPFSVTARDRIVLATGTSFDVDLSSSAVRVTLIEGRVVVFGGKQAQSESRSLVARRDGVKLAAGEQLTAGAEASALRVAKVDLEKATSWESGKLIFDDERLSVIAERVNRYTRDRIVIEDPTVGNLTISGVFNAGDTEAFLSILTAYFPVTVSREPEGVIRVRSQG